MIDFEIERQVFFVGVTGPASKTDLSAKIVRNLFDLCFKWVFLVSCLKR